MKSIFQKLCFVAMLLATTVAYSQVPTMSSLPTAPATIFLDFDGHTVQNVWSSYDPMPLASAGYTDAQITYIHNLVSEDFRPFNINVTTDSTKFLSAPPAQRIRIIVTPTSAWYPNVGGVAYTGSFTWGDDIGAFAFTNRVGAVLKNVAEVCSHESGHALGLSHQSRYSTTCSLVENYNSGAGTGQTSWAPIMGKAYGKNMTGWNDGPTPSNCTNYQDNLSIITGQNGFSYRADDYEEVLGTSTANINQVSFNVAGIISTTTDKDAFKFVNNLTTPIHIEVTPYSLGSLNEASNVDISVQLFNNSNQLVRTYNPEATMNVVIDTSLSVGTFYWVINGSGNTNVSDYGSLGSYSFSGSRGTLPIQQIALKAKKEGKLNSLQWAIIATEPIVAQVLESSTNGSQFAPIMTDNSGTTTTYAHVPATKANIFYRLKATSSIGETKYSNIVVLKADDANNNFAVTTLVQNNIAIIATETYQYLLLDNSGRIVKKGTQQLGKNNIEVANLTAGLYVLQMQYNNKIQVEKIIKL